ncbi:MAG: acyltransferase, partial [Planctomycetota bacterium]|nr:acyltransferase [Planctomycetota bacterium]
MIESPATHRHDIDGLRAVAILAVVLYHAGFPLFRGAFVGVDVFFVISGYFIAASLAASLQKPGFSVGQFYRRRAARIVPPLLVMTLCCVPAAHLLFLPQDYAMLGKTLISAGAFCSNLFFYSQGGYFDAPLEGNPFLHTWFLAIQGQFSLIFPLFFILVRRLRKGRETPVVALLFFASLLASAFMARYAPRAAYFFLASRGWELLAGALLALRIGRGNARDGSVLPAKLSETLALAAIASILMPIPLYTPRTPFPGLAALPPCIGAALLIWLP